LADVESLLQKHSIVEKEITMQSQRLREIDKKYNNLMNVDHPQKNVLNKHYASLKELYKVKYELLYFID
jgi:ADP-glucose pyrophosphorylase